MSGVPFIRTSEVVDQLVHKGVYDIIKEELKEKLKVRTIIEFPHTFSDGYLKTEVIYDDEVIHENTQTITAGSTAFSF